MAFFVENFVVGALDFSIFSWRNDLLYTRIFCAVDNFVRIVATIGQQNLLCKVLDQGNSFFTVNSWTICNNGSDWHIKHIYGQMPFMRLMFLLPPIVPHADELCNGLRRSSAIRNLDASPIRLKCAPRCPHPPSTEPLMYTSPFPKIF